MVGGDKRERSVSRVGTTSGNATRPDNPRQAAFEDWLWISPPPRPSLLLFLDVMHLRLQIVCFILLLQ